VHKRGVRVIKFMNRWQLLNELLLERLTRIDYAQLRNLGMTVFSHAIKCPLREIEKTDHIWRSLMFSTTS
jgi:hypothetical protein